MPTVWEMAAALDTFPETGRANDTPFDPGDAFSTTRAGSRAGWQQSLARAIRDPAQLLDRLNLPHSLLPGAEQGGETFPLLVPVSYVERMQPGDPDDPLLRQVLPVAEELRTMPGFQLDAVDDAAARRAPGLLHKYEGRALLMLARHCAVNCRYCFRRHYPYRDEPASLDDWQPAFDTLAADPTIHEVLLSGGDPLLLSNNRLLRFVERLEAIPHLRRLRIHSRLPVVLPDRVDTGLLHLLRETRLTPVMVVHANHPNEIAGGCAAALRTLVRQGITTLNQSVLLRGINDHADVLAELSERLIDLGVLPYYLHQLDRVQGTSHFEVPEARGLELIESLRQRLPGYAVPKYVREIAGEPGKTPLGSMGE